MSFEFDVFLVLLALLFYTYTWVGKDQGAPKISWKRILMHSPCHIPGLQAPNVDF